MKYKKKFVFFLLLSAFCLIHPLDIYAEEAIETKDVQDIAETIAADLSENEFAGMYIDNNGQLVVNVKGNGTMRSSIVNNSTYEDVVFNYVQYSLAELESMKDALVPYMLEYNIMSLDADEVNNVINIEMSEENEDIYELIGSLESIDTSVINITILEDVHLENTIADSLPEEYPEEFNFMYNDINDSDISKSLNQTEIIPGGIVYFQNVGYDSGYGTVGPKKNSNSFYSAGHCAMGNLAVYNRTMSTKYGQASGQTLGSAGDRCVVNISSSKVCLPSENKFAWGTGRYTISGGAIVGTDVEMWGGYSGVSIGEVTKTNVTVTVDGTTVGELSYASYSCKQGDSGAGVFSINASSDSSAKCYGIQSIGVFQENSETSYASYFCFFQ